MSGIRDYGGRVLIRLDASISNIIKTIAEDRSSFVLIPASMSGILGTTEDRQVLLRLDTSQHERHYRDYGGQVEEQLDACKNLAQSQGYITL